MQTPLQSDEQLLAALARGDRHATSVLYKKNYPIVRGWMVKGGADEADVSDIFQEAMVVLYEKAGEPGFKMTCSIGTYLFAVSKNLWYKKLEKQGRQPGIISDDGNFLEETLTDTETDVDAHREKENHFLMLDRALEQIGEPCRSLLKAYYHHDRNMQEIAAEFGYTNSENAKNQKYKCLTRLKKLFFTMQTP